MAESVGDMTLLEAINDLQADGYTADFYVVVAARPLIRCARCGATMSPADAEVLRLVRLEGESDPADEAIVAGLRCAACGAAGVLVAMYGPMADGAEADVVVALVDARRRG
jgi:hypothetical protein